MSGNRCTPDVVFSPLAEDIICRSNIAEHDKCPVASTDKVPNYATVHIDIDGRNMPVIVDTGSGASLIDAQVVKSHPRLSIRGLRAYEGNPLYFGDRLENLMPIIGVIKLNVNVGKPRHEVRIEALVLREFGCKPGILLGTRALGAIGAVINFPKNEMKIGKQILPMTSCKELQFDARQVRVLLTTRVAACSEQHIKVEIQGKSVLEGQKIDGVITPTEEFVDRYSLLTPCTVVRVDFTRIAMIRVLNVNDEPVILRSGSVVGYFTRLMGSQVHVVTPVNNSGKMGDTHWSESQFDDAFEDDDWHQGEKNGETRESFERKQELIREIATVTNKSLSAMQRRQLEEVILDNIQVFAQTDYELGYTDVVTHTINTGEAPPFKSKPYRTGPEGHNEIREQIIKMEKLGVIQESDSPWASPVVLVTKKDGSLRFCIDYRRLNLLTVKDAMPLPMISDTLDVLAGSCWFTSLDLLSAYWQVPVAEADKPKTAFISRYGLYEFNRLPFGLTNAPATFQRLMEKVLKGLQWEITLCYLDDIVVFGTTFREMCSRLDAVFKRLAQYNLKLKVRKCQFALTQIQY